MTVEEQAEQQGWTVIRSLRYVGWEEVRTYISISVRVL